MPKFAPSQPVGPASHAIRHARLRAGFSTTDLSKIVGLSHNYDAKLEAGLLQPSLRSFSMIAVALGLTPMEVWAVVVAEAAAATDDCTRCGGRKEVELPVNAADGTADLELLPCPVCQPWPQGFPGERSSAGSDKKWIVPPYGPGRTPIRRPAGRGRWVA